MQDVTTTDGHVRARTTAGLDSSAAMVRAESDHLDATLHALVKRLSSVPGLKMTVSYRHGRLRRLIGDLPYVNDLHRRTDPIEELVVGVGGCSYWLRAERGAIHCGRETTTVASGQVLEQLSFSDWAPALFDDIARQNFVNHDSLVALRQLVEQDRV
jgi:hypothetical protein